MDTITLWEEEIAQEEEREKLLKEEAIYNFFGNTQKTVSERTYKDIESEFFFLYESIVNDQILDEAVGDKIKGVGEKINNLVTKFIEWITKIKNDIKSKFSTKALKAVLEPSYNKLEKVSKDKKLSNTELDDIGEKIRSLAQGCPTYVSDENTIYLFHYPMTDYIENLIEQMHHIANGNGTINYDEDLEASMVGWENDDGKNGIAKHIIKEMIGKGLAIKLEGNLKSGLNVAKKCYTKATLLISEIEKMYDKLTQLENDLRKITKLAKDKTGDDDNSWDSKDIKMVTKVIRATMGSLKEVIGISISLVKFEIGTVNIVAKAYSKAKSSEESEKK